MLGHIIPDNIQKELNSIKKYNSKSQVIVTYEMTNSIEDLNKKLNR